MILSRAFRLRTAIAAACVAMAMPSTVVAQTAGGIAESASVEAASVEPTSVQPTRQPTSAAAASAKQVSSGATASNDFYVLAGFVLDRSGETRFTDRDCSSPMHLYGCATGIDDAPLGSLGDFGTTAGLELGGGYVAAPFLRLEATVQYRPSFSFDGRANFLQTTGEQSVSAELSSLSGMLAAYLDLPLLGLPQPGPFSPFIGGGIGLSLIDIDETRMEFPKTTTIVPGERRVNPAGMTTAGVTMFSGRTVTLDLAWRYTDFGAVETGKARGRIVWRDGSRDPLEIDLDKTRADLSSHELRVSIRYAF